MAISENMNWVTASLLVFSSSVFLYVLIRKAQVIGMRNEVNNLSQYLIPSLIYFLIVLVSGLSLRIPSTTLVILMLVAAVVSYLGNVFILEGIRLAPNPGYSLVIGKSYVVFTTLAALLLFHSSLSSKNALAIILIVLFSALISIGKKNTNKTFSGRGWLFYSLAAFFCWGVFALMLKYLIDRGISPFVILFYIFSIVSFIIFSEIYLKKIKFVRSKDYWLIFILIGLFGASFDAFVALGYKLAPNPGYINAVNAASISAVTLLSVYLFKDEFSVRKSVGVLGVTVGLILLFL